MYQRINKRHLKLIAACSRYMFKWQKTTTDINNSNRPKLQSHRVWGLKKGGVVEGRTGGNVGLGEELSWKICLWRWRIDGVFQKPCSLWHGALWERPGPPSPVLRQHWAQHLCCRLGSLLQIPLRDPLIYFNLSRSLGSSWGRGRRPGRQSPRRSWPPGGSARWPPDREPAPHRSSGRESDGTSQLGWRWCRWHAPD